MRLSSRERVLLVICVVFVVGVLFWSLTSGGKSAGSRSLLSYEDAEQKRVAARKALGKMEADQKASTPRVAKMTYDLPPDQLIPRVIRDLQTIAGKSNVHLREVKPLRVRALPSGGGTRIPMEVRFRASFQPDIVRFLYYVEDPARKMVVEKLSMTSADVRTKNVDVSAQVTVFTRSTAGASGAEGGESGNATNQANNS